MTELEAIGAGDQGMMFGYATNETEEYMPYPISTCTQAGKTADKGSVKTVHCLILRPDGKTQVTVEYDENGKPVRLDACCIFPHSMTRMYHRNRFMQDIKKYVIRSDPCQQIW